MENNVTFWPDNLHKSKPYTTNLQQRGVEVIHGRTNFESFIKKRGNEFHVCILARPTVSTKYIDLIKKHAKQSKIVYHTMDLHHIREMREGIVKRDSGKYEKAKRTKIIELDLIKKSDMTIVTSTSEAELLLNDDSELNFTVIPPFQIPSDESTTFSDRKDLLFLGGFQHKPNIDSLQNLITDIFPKIIEKIPEIKLYVVGSNATQEIIDLCNNNSNVVWLGYQKEIKQYLQSCRLLLAPLRYGAGVKGKITLSMAHGLVVITTKVGAEGISNENDNVLLIAKNDEDFIEKTVNLYNNKEIWTSTSTKAKQFIDEFFSPENTKETLIQMIANLLKPSKQIKN